jgi:hypothetical protein
VSPVCIPLSCCNQAADTLIDWFGHDDIKVTVGGERWWQVRGMDGIDAEWITERAYLSEAKPCSGPKLSPTDQDITRMENLEAVMVREYHTNMDLSLTYVPVLRPWRWVVQGQSRNRLLTSIVSGGYYFGSISMPITLSPSKPIDHLPPRYSPISNNEIWRVALLPSRYLTDIPEARKFNGPAFAMNYRFWPYQSLHDRQALTWS